MNIQQLASNVRLLHTQAAGAASSVDGLPPDLLSEALRRLSSVVLLAGIMAMLSLVGNALLYWLGWFPGFAA